LTDPLLLQDGCVAQINDPQLGPVRQVGITYRLDCSRGEIRGPAPSAGEHTEAVKAEAAAIAASSIGPAAAGAPPGPGRNLRAPLDGITVLDLGLAVAGPYGTQVLADLGASVIKINALYDTYWHSNHIAYIANRGKRSLALDLKDPRAMKILLQLVERADVVQHNMRYDAAQRLAIDYESLKKINPKLIYCHTRGFETGPRESLPGNDQTGGCLAGVQYEDGAMGRGGKPLWSFCSLGDTGNGFLSAIAIIQALYHRDRTGQGQMCDTSIVNAQLLNTSYALARPDGTGFDRPQVDRLQFGFSATHRLYETSSGWLCVVLATDEHWSRLCAAMRLESLALDERFATADARARNDEALAGLLEMRFYERPAAEWFAVLDEAGVPCEICDPGFALKLHDDPQFAQRHWVVSYQHPFVGKLDQIGLPFELSETPGRIQGPPLVVGQHSREILAELGYSPQQIEELCAECVLAWSPAEGHRKIRSPWEPPARSDASPAKVKPE
jgi:crotonobetainyl-CoA:carnitine CoA-transferase CaiB-like acyl-CoA transferase